MTRTDAGNCGTPVGMVGDENERLPSAPSVTLKGVQPPEEVQVPEVKRGVPVALPPEPSVAMVRLKAPVPPSGKRLTSYCPMTGFAIVIDSVPPPHELTIAKGMVSTAPPVSLQPTWPIP